MNFLQILQMMQRGNSPQQVLINMLQSQAQNNPFANNLLTMAQNGDMRGLENVARNITKERGVDSIPRLTILETDFTFEEAHMFNNSNGYSLSDIAAATNNDGNGSYGFGNGGWWIILLFIVFFAGGFGGNGWGTGSTTATLDTNYLSTGIRDLQSGLSSNFMTLNNELLNGFCDNRTAFANNTASILDAVTNGFNTQNLANLQNSNAIQRDIYSNTVGNMQNTQALQMTLNQMESNSRADTCALNTNNANNTRDIIDAINNGNQMLASMMQQNKFEAMQAENANLRNQVQMQNLAASQAAQTASIIDQLRPSPVPAYTVQNPYCNCGNVATYNMANI